jgi:hypothetical protein
VNPWRGTAPELAIAGIAYVAIALAGYLVAGPAGLGVVTVVAAAVALAAQRMLLPVPRAEAVRTLKDKPTAQSISGYSRRRFVIRWSSETSGFYESELRPALEHILAARLAERHSANMYADPEAARAIIGDPLWYWIDPDLAETRLKRTKGIPPRTLARLIDRLERL